VPNVPSWVVAAGILTAVEPGLQPGGTTWKIGARCKFPTSLQCGRRSGRRGRRLYRQAGCLPYICSDPPHTCKKLAGKFTYIRPSRAVGVTRDTLAASSRCRGTIEIVDRILHANGRGDDLRAGNHLHGGMTETGYLNNATARSLFEDGESRRLHQHVRRPLLA